MAKIKLFISSVQSEFANERKALHDYISSDALLGKFFVPFLFELLPAIDQQVDTLYLNEVEHSDIYLGILGVQYGFENAQSISPTEQEFDHATLHHKTRLLFLTNHATNERLPKQQQFVNKVQDVLVRKKFSSIDELKAAVYAALIRYLEEKEIIRSAPFDATLNMHASIDDLEDSKIKDFVRLARFKRGFPLQETDSIVKVLSHLNLMDNHRITNAALLLFGKTPQRYFINSEVRCASFRSTIVEKPIPSYKVFKGTVFELVEQALEFVLAKLDYSIGTREQDVSIPGNYEIPKEVIAEAIVNAIAHRDYTSNASVQIMLFTDRLEIWNPGTLPMGWTTEKLKQLHSSVPFNPLLSEPLYLAGYIERLGTGTADIVSKSIAHGLKEPEFVQADDFKTILYRPISNKVSNPVREQVKEQVTGKYYAGTEELPQELRSTSVEVRSLILVVDGEVKRLEIQEKLNLSHEGNFRENYLEPALNEGFIEMKYPQKNHPNQKYRLTQKGQVLQELLKTKN